MAQLEWDKTGTRFYKTGVDKATMAPIDAEGKYTKAVAWSGISKVSESPSGGESTAVYADNIKYLSLQSSEDFGGTIEAYYYPDEFSECNGEKEAAKGVMVGQQARKPFAFTYQTRKGNDVDKQSHGYIINVVYGAEAKPSSQESSTINENPEASTMSWEFSTTPVNVAGLKPTAILRIDSTKVDKTKLATLESKLYGGENSEASIPLPDEIINIFKTE